MYVMVTSNKSYCGTSIYIEKNYEYIKVGNNLYVEAQLHQNHAIEV